jgi:hypothetical protein
VEMIKSLKEYLAESKPNYVWFTFQVEEYIIHILFDSSTTSVLTEAKHKGTPLDGQYSAQLHSAHSSVGQQHIHVYEKNNQLFSLNKDGTAHDASHQTQIPNKVANAIKSKFPDFNLPPNNFIESAPTNILGAVSAQLLLG